MIKLNNRDQFPSRSMVRYKDVRLYKLNPLLLAWHASLHRLSATRNRKAHTASETKSVTLDERTPCKISIVHA